MDPEMDGQIQTQTEDQNSQIEIDSWEAAFAALDKKNKETTEVNAELNGNNNEDADSSAGSKDDRDSKANDGNTGSITPEARDDNVDEDNAGGLDNSAGADSGSNDGDSGDLLGISEEEIQEYRDGIVEEIRDRAINDIAQEFIKRGIRHKNGKLGATIEDEDICKRDEDGVPRFYNPETGREFTGDNPRRQAQEWVEDYNKELARAFNEACEGYSNKLMESEMPQIAVLEFAGTYDKLDPIRKMMFENIIEDYEITDNNGDLIGYSCDLNKALNAVNRQVESIQAHAKTMKPETPASGPALDIKNSSGAVSKPDEKPEFKSLEEAMLWQQNQLLANQKKEK